MQLRRLVEREQRVDELDQRAAQADLVHRRIADVLTRALGATFAARRPDPIDERLALDELHREEPRALRGVELVQRDQVGMDDVGERAELALEPIQIAARGRAQLLERDFALQRLIVDPIYGARSTRSEGATHLEPAGSE
jgi:hypothetical protein